VPALVGEGGSSPLRGLRCVQVDPPYRPRAGELESGVLLRWEAAEVFDDCGHGHGDLGATKALVVPPWVDPGPGVRDGAGHGANCRCGGACLQPVRPADLAES
jgi:hypothetical protein